MTTATETMPAANSTPAKLPVKTGERGLVLSSMDDMWRFATCVASSGLAPKGMDRPETVLVAIQLGLELGLSPMSALQNIGVINGRPGIYGDAALALVRASGLLDYITEEYEGTGDGRKAICCTKRRGAPKALTTEFSVADARRAQLWGKAGPWTQYPDRMLRFRARGFNLRDNFGDVLKGFATREELEDQVVSETAARRALPPPDGRHSLRAPAPEPPPVPEDNGFQPDPPAPEDVPPPSEDDQRRNSDAEKIEEDIARAADAAELDSIGEEIGQREEWLGPERCRLLDEALARKWATLPKAKRGK